MQAHNERSQIIKRCITEVSDIVNTLRKQREAGDDSAALTMKLRSERNKVILCYLSVNDLHLICCTIVKLICSYSLTENCAGTMAVASVGPYATHLCTSQSTQGKCCALTI